MLTTITPGLIKATRERRPRRVLELNPHLMRALHAGEPQSPPLRPHDQPARSPWRAPVMTSPSATRDLKITTVISPMTIAKRRQDQSALVAAGAKLDALAQENARLRATAGAAVATKRDWIAVALLAAAGRMTVADVLMRANPRVQQSLGQTMNAAVEAARSKLGPAVANPLLEQAGLV